MTVDEEAAHDQTAPDHAALTTSLLIAIVLVAANLRAGLTGVGPLLPTVEHATGLSETWGGLLVTLPLLTFAATSPLAGRAARRHGARRVLALALPLLAAGLVVRSLPGIGFLFGGTVVIAAAIAVGNVLLPPVVRSTVPKQRVSQVTAVYVTAMGLVAAISSGVSVPLADVLPGGWRSALGCWAVLAVVAMPAWLPYLRRGDRDARQEARQEAPAGLVTEADFAKTPTKSPSPWRSPLAWQISLFMGLQSLGFYATISWLPSIVHDHGTSTATAGWELFLFQAVGLVASITLPLVLRRHPDQRVLAAAASILMATGFALLAVTPSLAVVTCVLTGFGSGATLVLALTFQGQRASQGPQAASLAAMAQSVGYLVAAVGPLLLGTLHSLTGGWTLPVTLLAGIACAQALLGLGAGRDVTWAPAPASSDPSSPDPAPQAPPSPVPAPPQPGSPTPPSR
ncbi:MFS transporter [Catenulispora sp. NF23]|uniref:CynX/NimT family MFS transporter n=1 Tax=Catenulispora pinistramenti TaxID=2705254 RepID=UPI001BAA1B99|nr:MFS transporter [Catenulispora pinistramenti]